MESVVAACFDAYYYENYAKASCIVFQRDEQEYIISEYNEKIDEQLEATEGFVWQ